MYTIWKYHLVIDDVQFIHVPADAKILTVQAQYDDAVLWILLNDDESPVARKIQIFCTGQQINSKLIEDNKLIYIGTFQLEDSLFVGHVFEVI